MNLLFEQVNFIIIFNSTTTQRSVKIVEFLNKVYSSIGLDDRFSFCKEQFDSAIDYNGYSKFPKTGPIK